MLGRGAVVLAVAALAAPGAAPAQLAASPARRLEPATRIPKPGRLVGLGFGPGC